MLERLLGSWGRFHAWSVVVAVAGVAWVIYRSKRRAGRKPLENGVSWVKVIVLR